METPTITKSIEPTSPTNNTLQQALEAHRKSQAADLKEQDSPHIFIVGPSGSGKSRSIINLPPPNTLIFNPEGKPLPFEDAAKFKDRKLSGFKTIQHIKTIFKAAVNDDSIRYIVFDSFTEWLELLKKEAEQTYKGYEIFNYYAREIQQFLFDIRQVKNKIIIIMSLDELTKTEQDNGSLKSERYATCEGKMFTKLESKFSIVLFTHRKLVPASNPPEIIYQFATKSDGVTSAKSPEKMFPFYIANDLNLVVKEVEKYFNITYK